MLFGIRGAHWVALATAAGLGAVAFATGFDDATLTPYQFEFARLLASVLGGLGVIASALRYVWERQQELAWEKTRFMVGLFKEFEEDPRLRRAQVLVDVATVSGDTTRLRAALAPLGELVSAAEANPSWWRPRAVQEAAERLEDRLALDRYLDFFDHLYTYIFITKTLSTADARSFSGYVGDVLYLKPLADFSIDEGYEDVMRLALVFLAIFDRERPPEKRESLRQKVAEKQRNA